MGPCGFGFRAVRVAFVNQVGDGCRSTRRFRPDSLPAAACSLTQRCRWPGTISTLRRPAKGTESVFLFPDFSGFFLAVTSRNLEKNDRKTVVFRGPFLLSHVFVTAFLGPENGHACGKVSANEGPEIDCPRTGTFGFNDLALADAFAQVFISRDGRF